MKNYLKLFLLLCLALGFIAAATTGCQTSKGLGRDVEYLGDKMQGK